MSRSRDDIPSVLSIHIPKISACQLNRVALSPPRYKAQPVKLEGKNHSRAIAGVSEAKRCLRLEVGFCLVRKLLPNIHFPYLEFARFSDAIQEGTA